MPTLIVNDTANTVTLPPAYGRQVLLSTAHTVVQDSKTQVDAELSAASITGLTTTPMAGADVTGDGVLQTAPVASLPGNTYTRFDTTAGNINQDLPLAADSAGQTIILENAAGANVLTAVATGGDSLQGTATAAAGVLMGWISNGGTVWTRLALD